jgi:excinuclease UvrABC ATPase subunit
MSEHHTTKPETAYLVSVGKEQCNNIKRLKLQCWLAAMVCVPGRRNIHKSSQTLVDATLMLMLQATLPYPASNNTHAL